jgi:hypothetical protein
VTSSTVKLSPWKRINDGITIEADEEFIVNSIISNDVAQTTSEFMQMKAFEATNWF